MSLPLLIAFLVLFTVLIIFAINSSIKLSRAKDRIYELENDQQKQMFESELIKEITEAIDANLDIQKVVATICKRLEILIPYSTISSLVVRDDQLLLTINAHEPVSHDYMEDVKTEMLQSLAALDKRAFSDTALVEDITGSVSDTTEKQPIASIAHLPLLLHQSVAAIITVTALQPDRFQPEGIQSLQFIMSEVSKSLSKLDAILQEERGRLYAMIGSLSDGLLLIDKENTLQIINPAGKRLLSLEREHVTTMDVLSALPIHFDFRSKLMDAIHHSNPSEIPNIPLKNKQLRCTITPVLGTTGKSLGAVLVLRDETLTNSVPRMKEDFTNILVHELRNPLTSIKVSSDLLASHPEFSPEEQKKLQHLIAQQSTKLLANVQQILDAAKLEAGVFVLHKKQAHLKDVIQTVTGEFQKEAQEKLFNFSVDIDPHLPFFAFDPHYIHKALENLLTNSMKFTATGGTIHVTARQKDKTAVITITDSGAGIPKDQQHKVFNKFSQFEDASATVGKGLGLYLVRGIIEAHGGNVTIDSDRGRGTAITLTLPITEPTQLASHVPHTPIESHKLAN